MCFTSQEGQVTWTHSSQLHGLVWVTIQWHVIQFLTTVGDYSRVFPFFLASIIWTHNWHVSSSGASLYELMLDSCKSVVNEDMITSHFVEKLTSRVLDNLWLT